MLARGRSLARSMHYLRFQHGVNEWFMALHVAPAKRILGSAEPHNSSDDDDRDDAISEGSYCDRQGSRKVQGLISYR